MDSPSIGEFKDISNKRIITIVAIIIIIIILISALIVIFRRDDIPDPGVIYVHYIDYSFSNIHDVTIEFGINSINVTVNMVNRSTNELSTIEEEYDRSFGDDIWNPIMKGLIENKGHKSTVMCGCLPDREIEMIDDKGNMVVHGEFNSHKFHVYVQGTYTRIQVNQDSDLQEGYNNLDDLCNDVID